MEGGGRQQLGDTGQHAARRLLFHQRRQQPPVHRPRLRRRRATHEPSARPVPRQQPSLLLGGAASDGRTSFVRQLCRISSESALKGLAGLGE